MMLMIFLLLLWLRLLTLLATRKNPWQRWAQVRILDMVVFYVMERARRGEHFTLAARSIGLSPKDLLVPDEGPLYHLYEPLAA